jgi:hypothetical protein
MFSSRHYQSRAAEALEISQQSRTRRARRNYVRIYAYLHGLALAAEAREITQTAPATFARDTHDLTVRKYRTELATTPEGLGRRKLVTLLARMKMAAEEQGWPETV